jgi:hypothetical protein
MINCNTLLHVSTLLGHLQGELVCYKKKVLPEDEPAGSKHAEVCYN